MKTKFTNGPWIKEDFSFEIKSKNCCLPIAKVTVFNEAKANAHLIAAAPDMYRSLQRQRKGLLNLIELDLISASHIDSVRHEISLIDNELAKARGE